jgi:hypothetical protein
LRTRTYRTDTITRFHDLKGVVDLTKGLLVSDEFIDLERAVQIIPNESRQFRATLDTAEGATPPYTACNKLERTSSDFLSSSSNTDNDALTPSLMTSFQSSPHNANVAGTIKGVIAATVRDIDEVFLDGFLEFGGIDKVGCAEFLGPRFLVIVGVDGDDLGGAVGDAALDDAETDAAGTEDGSGGALFNLGSSGGGTIAGGDTASEETSFVERGLGADSDNRDVGDN